MSFDGYPPFFLAHELAHQWWGQAVGWKNYHEQWLSEGFAQYFAAHVRGEGPRRRRRSATCCARCGAGRSNNRTQGPVYLGYRLGHIKAESRVFRAVVYNKGAMVLHMLRRLVGDEKFFARHPASSMRDWRFRKAGTDDFRLAMEKASRAGSERVLRSDGSTDRRCRVSASPRRSRRPRPESASSTAASGDSHPGDGFDCLSGRLSRRDWSSSVNEKVVERDATPERAGPRDRGEPGHGAVAVIR